MEGRQETYFKLKTHTEWSCGRSLREGRLKLWKGHRTKISTNPDISWLSGFYISNILQILHWSVCFLLERCVNFHWILKLYLVPLNNFHGPWPLFKYIYSSKVPSTLGRTVFTLCHRYTMAMPTSILFFFFLIQNAFSLFCNAFIIHRLILQDLVKSFKHLLFTH